MVGLVGLGLVVTAIAVGAAVFTRSDGPTTARSTAGTAAPRFTESGVVRVPDLAARQTPATAWTGTRLFVFGGYQSVDDGTSNGRRLLPGGALVDVETGRADELPRPPFAAPLLYPFAVRAGDRIVVAGIECARYRSPEDTDTVLCGPDSGQLALASFDEARGRWGKVSRLPNLETAPSGGTPDVWIRQLLGSESGGAVLRVADRSDDEHWLVTASGSLTALPDPGSASDACVTGNRIAVMNAASTPVVRVGGLVIVPGIEPTTFALRLLDLATSDPTWVETPPVELVPGTAPALACLGDHVLVTRAFSQGAEGHLFDVTTSTWTEVPAPPPNPVTTPDGQTIPSLFFGTADQRVWTGSELLELTDFAVPLDSTGSILSSRAYDPTTNTWRALPPLPTRFEAPQWVGTAAVGYGTRRRTHPTSKGGCERAPADHWAECNPSVVVHYVPR